MSIWYSIQDHPIPDKEIHVVGYNEQATDQVISGIKYDIHENCILNQTTGRWMRITHWTYVP